MLLYQWNYLAGKENAAAQKQPKESATLPA